jgi:hypothetical protein
MKGPEMTLKHHLVFRLVIGMALLAVPFSTTL